MLLYKRDSILKGFIGRLFLLLWWWCSDNGWWWWLLLSLLSWSKSKLRSSSVLVRRCIVQSSGSSSHESSPTTSIWSSSSPCSPSLSVSDWLIRCWDRYSALSASKSTVMPFARSLRAWRSRAFANFFLRRVLQMVKEFVIF